MKVKDLVETSKNVATILAILVGAWWSYHLFVVERKHYPHANIEQKVTHVELSDRVKLLRVEIALTNTGNAMLLSSNAVIRIQQISPVLSLGENEPSATKQINAALGEIERKEDRFSWPLVAERSRVFNPPRKIEPNERDTIDFEFAVPSDIKVVRVYTQFQNDEKKNSNEGSVGWSTSTYYELRKTSMK